MKLWKQIGIKAGFIAIALFLGLSVGVPALVDDYRNTAIEKAVFTIGVAGEAYAAVPDYIVDGTDDHVQAQLAVDALPATGGKVIFFGGNYDFGATITRAINNITIEGSGQSTYFANDGGTALFSAGAQTGWVFRDFRTDAGGITVSSAASLDTILSHVEVNGTILGKTVRTGTRVVAAYNASITERSQSDYVCDGTADDVQIQAAITAVLADKGGSVYLSEGLFKCTSAIVIPAGINNGAGTVGLSIIGAGIGNTKIIQKTAHTNLFTFDNTATTSQCILIEGFSATTVAGTGDVFSVRQVMRSTFRNILVPGAGRYAFDLQGVLMNTFSDIIVSTNFAAIDTGTNTFTRGINMSWSVDNGGSACNANLFNNVIIEGGSAGYYMSDQHETQGNNTFFGGTVEGVVGTGFYADNLSGLRLLGMHFEANTLDISLIRAHFFTIEPGLLDTVTLGAGCSHFEISDSINYVATQYGTSDIGAGGNSIVVAHGLPATPLQIRITPLDDPGNDASFWVDTIGAANFTIHSTANVVGETTIAWFATIGDDEN